MKFELSLVKYNLHSLMRNLGYAPEGQDPRTGELKFSKALGYSRYPRFHLYIEMADDKSKAFFNLHLDQKQPSYGGTAAHSGEYKGELVENEAGRIKSIQ